MRRFDGVYAKTRTVIAEEYLHHPIRFFSIVTFVIAIGLGLMFFWGPLTFQTFGSEQESAPSEQSSDGAKVSNEFLTESYTVVAADQPLSVEISEKGLQPEIEVYGSRTELSSTDDFEIKIEDTDQNETITLTPNESGAKAGLYEVVIKNPQTGAVLKSEKVAWGVLAFNPDYAVYPPGTHADLAMAVLDDRGKMVCNADVTLEITDPTGGKTTVSTSDKTITVSPDCQVYGPTSEPDYHATYQTGPDGEYRITLVATVGEATRTLTDTFWVKGDQDFYLKRELPTRIYPPTTYEAKLIMQPKKSGTYEVEESVPKSFEISETKAEITVEENKQVLRWSMEAQANEDQTLSYKFKAPNISPYLFLVGPASVAYSAEVAASATKAVETTVSTPTEIEDSDIENSVPAPPSSESEVGDIENSTKWTEPRSWLIASDNACQSLATGNWSATGSWQNCGGTVPQAADTVQILNTHNITEDTASVTVAGVTIDLGGTLTVSTTNAITVSGNWSNSGTFTAATGTVTFSSTATGKTLAGTMTGASSFYNLVFDGVAGGWTYSNAVAATNDFTVTNGAVTANNLDLTVTRDFTLANTAGVSYSPGTSTVTVSRHWTDSGSKMTSIAGLTIVMNGTGTLQETAANMLNVQMGYSGQTTTISSNTHLYATGVITFNGGTVSATSWLGTYTSGTNKTPLVFASPTTLTGSGDYVYYARAANTSINMAAGDYGNWSMELYASGGTTTDVTWTMAGNITTTNSINVEADTGGSGTFGTGNFTLTAGSYIFGSSSSSRAGTTISNFGSSTVALGTHSPSLYAGAYGTNTLNLQSSTVSATGNVTFSSTFGTVSVTPGTSTVNMTSTATGKTITSNAQSFYNLVFNGVGGGWTFQDATIATNDFTVTNGAVTAANLALTVTRDFTLANTAGVSYTAGSSTVTVSRHWTDSGAKFVYGTSTVVMNGTGTQTGANSYYNFSIGYSGLVTTISNNVLQIFGVMTVNGGTVTASGSYYSLKTSITNTPFVFASPTTLNGSLAALSFENSVGSITTTIAGGNYGNWPLYLQQAGTAATGTFQLGGNFSSTSSITIDAAAVSTGVIFDTTASNYSISNYQIILGYTSTGRISPVAANFNGSAITLTSDLKVDSDGGSHTLDMGSSAVTTAGNVLFSNGTGTITVTPGTSTLTWNHTSGTKTYAPNGQSLYNMTLNGSGGTVTPNAAVIVTNDLTMTAGTLSGTQNVTVNSNVAGTAGVINLTGGTFTQSVTAAKNFGTTSGSTAWTFYNLTFTATSNFTITTQTGGTGDITVISVLNISSSTTVFNGGNRTYHLMGSGTPFTKTGIFTASTSTVSYENTTSATITGNGSNGSNYYNLQTSPASGTPTYTFSGGGTSFLAGTLVSTPSGNKPIESLKIDDLVLSYDLATNTVVSSSVIRTISGYNQSYYIINNKVKVTGNHVFFLADHSQKTVEELMVGEELATISGTETIKTIQKVIETVQVYDIEVETYHLFFANDYLVHNAVGGGGCTGTSTAQSITASNNFTMTGAGSAIIDAETLDPSVIVTGNFTIGANQTYQASSTAALFLIGGSYSNSGTFTANSSQVIFNATVAGKTLDGTMTGNSAFYNLTFNSSCGNWTPSAAVTVTNNLTMSAGTLSGTQNVTVNGAVAGTAGIISLTGGTFEQRVGAAKNFGTTSGSTAWTFSSLTFSNSHASSPLTVTTQTGGTGGITVSGVLSVGKTGDAAGATTTLNAGNRTWTLSGTGGDPFQLLASPLGALSGGTSKFYYTGANAGGDTTIQSTSGSYYDLELNTADTFVLEADTVVTNNLTITHASAILDVTASNFALSIGNNYSNSGTFTARSGTVTFNATDSGNTLSGTLNGTSAFYKVIFNGVAGAWTIQDPMLVDTSAGTPAADTLVVSNGTVTVGNGNADNLLVYGGIDIAIVANQTAVLQTMDALAEGSTITVQVNKDTSTQCANCIVDVGASSGSGQGTLTINENGILKLIPKSSATASDTGVEVASTGKLNVTGALSLAETTSTAITDYDNRETKICANATFTTDQYNSLNVRATSGLAIGQIYPITDTTVDDVQCDTATHDSITRADTSTASVVSASKTLSNNNGIMRVCIPDSISAANQKIGSYMRDFTGTKGYFQIVDSFNDDANCTGTDDRLYVIESPDVFSGFTAGDTIDISDGVRPGDTFEIYDYAHVTAEDGVACTAAVNEAGESYLHGGAGSETVMNYADLCNLGRNATGKEGVRFDSVNGTNASEGVTIDRTRSRSNYYGAVLEGSANNNTANSKGITNSSATSNTIQGFRVASSSNNNTLTSNRAAGGGSGGFGLNSSNNNTFSSNIAIGNSNTGFLLQSSNNNTFSSNTATGNANPGFYIAPGLNNTFSSNTAIGNANYGFTLESSANNNTLTSNTAIGNALYGFIITSSKNNILTSNIATGNISSGFLLNVSSSNNILSSNTSTGNGSWGFRIGIANNNTLIGNQSGGQSYGLYISDDTATTGNVVINDVYGTTANTTADILFAGAGAHTLSLHNTTLSSSTEVTGVTVAGAYIVSKKHDTSAGVTKIWGEYAIPSDTAETPQDEDTDKFNYANNLWEKSVTAHGYSGTGTEDTNLSYDLSAPADLSAGPYAYMLVTKTAGVGASCVTSQAVMDVYRNGTDVGDLTTGTLFTDSTGAVNTKFTVDCGATPYALNATYTFTAYDADNSTSAQKTMTMMTDGDIFTVGSGKTLEMKGQTTSTNLTTVTRGATGGYHFDIAGTIDAQYYKFSYLGGTSGGNGLDLQSGATITNLDDGEFDNYQNVGATDTYITVYGSLIGTGAPAKTWDNMTFLEASDAVPEYSVTQTATGAPAAGNYWSFFGSTCTGWTDCEASDSDTGDGGSDTYGFLHFSSSISIQGIVYLTNESTIGTSGNGGPCDGSTAVITARVDGGSAATATCSASTAAYTVYLAITPTAGQTVTIYLTSASKGNTVTLSDAATDTGVDIYIDHVVVRHEAAGYITNSGMDQYDNDDNATDMLYTSTFGGILFDVTVEANIELHVSSGKEYRPSGTVTTGLGGDFHNVGTTNMGGNALSIGGSYNNAGTFTSLSNTTTFTSTATGETLAGTMTGASSFYNLVFDGVAGGWTYSNAVAATNDFTVTNGAVTANNLALTVTRDFTLANTAGVSYTAGSSTVTVSRHFSDAGTKLAQGTSTVTLNGTGTVTKGGSFYNLSVGYSTFTTTFGATSFGVTNILTFNGGTVTGGSQWNNLTCAGTCTPVVFASPTTLNGTNTLYFRNDSAGTKTIAGGNYGSWTVIGTAVTGNGSVFNLGGDLTTTSSFNIYAGSALTGTTFNTQNYALTALRYNIGHASNTGATANNLGSSTITLSSAADGLLVVSNGGSHTLVMGSSSTTVAGNVLFVNGTGTVTVTPDTSTLTWNNTSGTATYAPNGQSLYNMTLNGSGGTVTPNAAVIVSNDLTMTAGTLSGTQNVTVNGNVAGTAGIISLTGGTFEHRFNTDRNFGTTSGSTAWTFNNLTFSNSTGPITGFTATTQTGGTGGITVSGVLKVGLAGDNAETYLNAGNRTWTLSGTGGDPFQLYTINASDLIPATSTFSYTGANAGGNTTVQLETYYNLTINASDTFVLEAATTASNTLTITTGTLDTVSGSDYALTAGTISVAASQTLTTNGSTVTLTGTGTVFSMSATGVFTAATSTIKITDTTNTAVTFDGGGKTYNNIWFSRGASTASNTIASSNTFADFRDNGSAAHSILFTNGTTTTVTTFTVSGTAGNEITINSDTTATHTLTKAGGGTISRDYLNIQHSVATPATTWYAGYHSTDNQAVVTAGSGWIFSSIDDLTINSSATTNAGSSPNWVAGAGGGNVNITDIQTAINAGTNVSFTAGNDIIVSNAFTKSSGADVTMTMYADRDIRISAAISSSSNKMTMLINANRAADTIGYVNIAAALTSNNGNITIGGGSGAISAGSGFAVGSSDSVVGVLINNVAVAAGTGTVIINGQGFATTTSSNYGIRVTGATGALATTGSGTISITGNGGGTTDSGSNYGLYVDTGGIISTVDGNLTVNATGGGGGTGGSNYGTRISDTNSTIKTTGNGNLSVTGTGGNASGSGGDNSGVRCLSASCIQKTTSTGTLTVTGTGGAGSSGSGGDNYGVYVGTPGSITAAGGAITINGTGGNSSGNSNYGVRVSGASAVISNTGSGTISITGNGGGTTDSGSNYGLYVDTGGIISTVDGNLTVNATGGGAGTGGSNYGTRIVDTNSTIKTTGNGNLSVTGTGGNASGSGDFNYGVYCFTATCIQKTTSTGTLSVTGTGGNASGSSDSSVGVVVNTPGSITAAGGTLTVTGTGGTSSGNTNYGVQVTGAAAVISNTGSGIISITGVGGGITNSSSNHGLLVDTGGIVSTVDGNLTVNNSTGGGAGTGTANHGVYVTSTNSTIKTTGNGNLSVTGTGGNASGSGDYNYGVYCLTATCIQKTTSTGTLTITGTGGNASGSSDSSVGVVVNTPGSITAAGGAMTVTGTGGTSSGNSNYGVHVSGAAALISNTGSGTISITGNGAGTTNSASDHGLRVDIGGIISTVDGNLTINNSTAGGAGTGATNYGVLITDTNSTIKITGTGNLSVTGTGGNASGSGANNYGVFCNSASCIQKTTGTGTLTVTGTGGNGLGGGGATDIGVYVGTPGSVTAAGGAITINGTGGASTGVNNHGVRVSGAAAVISNTGSGTISITGNGAGSTDSSGNYGTYLDSGAIVSTVDGNLTVNNSTGGGAGTGGSNYGVRIASTSSTIKTTGTGNLSVTGTGGNGSGSGSTNYGVLCEPASCIQTTSTGTLTVTGTGSASSGGGNRGVYVLTPGSITATGGAITINGTGGASSGNTNVGVLVSGAAAVVSNTGSGTISITGNGAGTTNSSFDTGLRVESGGIISTVDGNLTVNNSTGGGAGTGAGNYGVIVTSTSSTIKTTGTGNLAITGTGGNASGSGGSNYGVYCFTANCIQTTSTGTLTVTGTGGNGSGSGGSSRGVYVDTSGSITAAGGTLTVTGTGGASSGSSNYGIQVTGATAGISNTGSGTISITGNGGGITDSASNYGLTVDNGGIISTVDGNLTVSNSTGGGAGTGTGNYGVRVNDTNSTIKTTGTGNLAVTGTGGNASGSGGSNYGVSCTTANCIQTTGTGTLTVTGTGGNGSGSGGDNLGVRLATPGSITAVGGAMTINGTGGASSGGSNYGVRVTGAAALITNTGSGTISITGNGGGVTNSGSNYGLYVDTGGIVSTVDGNLTVNNSTGGGAGTGATNYGVYVTSTSSTIKTTGTGNLAVTGTGGNASGSGTDNYGVHCLTANCIQTTSTGILTVTGTGSASSGGTNYGVIVRTPGSITAAGGAMTITGTGGNSSGSNNRGVLVTGAAAVISNTGSGTISITGNGAGITNSGSDYGLRVDTGGIISTVDGNLTVSATGGGAGTGTANYGVYVSSTIKTTGTGNLSVTGIRGGGDTATNYGVNVAIANGFQTTSTGTITVITDTILLAQANNINSIGSLTIRPYTATSTVGVGAGSGTLGLTDTFLTYITWGTSSTLTIGGTTAGNIAINSASTILNQSVTFLTGGDITLATTALAHAGASAATLTMQAYGTITTTSAITAATSALTILLYSDFDANASGTISIGAGVQSNGGTITVQGGGGTISTASTFDNLTVVVGSNTITLGATFNDSGNLTITSGTFDVSATPYAANIGGNYSNSGTFTARTGTVTLNGSAAQALSGTMTGSSAFYDLTLTNSSGTVTSDCERTGWVAGVDFNAAATVTNNYTVATASVKVEYESGATYTINNMNWNGQAVGTRLYFRNSAITGTWLLNVTAVGNAQTKVSYINVSRSDASGGALIIASDGTNTDCGTNTNWQFDETLTLGIDSTSKDFGTILPGANPSDQTSTLTATSNAVNGYVIYAWSTQAMTNVRFGGVTLADWTGTNATPTTFSAGSNGFGYSTDDASLTGGTADRFTNGGAKFAGFSHTGPGDPVADRTAPATAATNDITYRLYPSNTQANGDYTTVVVYVITAAFP